MSSKLERNDASGSIRGASKEIGHSSSNNLGKLPVEVGAFSARLKNVQPVESNWWRTMESYEILFVAEALTAAVGSAVRVVGRWIGLAHLSFCSLVLFK